jgi:hypothetical protein
MKSFHAILLKVGLLATGLLNVAAYADEAPGTAAAATPTVPATTTAAATLNAVTAPAAAAQDPRDQKIDDLTRVIEELRKRVEELEKRPAAAPAPTPAPAPEPAPGGVPAPTGGGATLLPNISALGNVIFRGGDTKGTEGRGRFNLQEVEFAFQDRVAPNLRADFFLSAEKEEDWTAAIEEGYLTYSNILGIAGLSTRFGKLRTPFGKLNPTHPHTWRFIDQPSVITAFLGPDGLNSDGAVLQYLLPIKGVFANLEIGRWQTTSPTEDGRGFGGDGNDAWSGRLWLGKEIGRDRELEIGYSRYQGTGTPEGFPGETRLAINGVDLTYRAFPSAYRRLLIQAEGIQHQTTGGGKTRYGGYLNAALQLNQFYEIGARGDYTRFPFPVAGHESAVSAYLTRYLTEQTSIRLQLRHGTRPDDGTFNEAFLQFLFGFGPHSHLLQ